MKQQFEPLLILIFFSGVLLGLTLAFSALAY